MTIKEISELFWRNFQPSSKGEHGPVTLGEIISTAIAEYAYQMLLMVWKEKADNGYYEVPGYLLKTAVLPVVDNSVDISGLSYFKSLPNEVWLQGVGEGCTCRYIKTTKNTFDTLCDSDIFDDGDTLYYLLGDNIIFPNGTKDKEVPIVYASKGDDVMGNFDIDNAMAALIRRGLMQLYNAKIPEDVTSNENSNN